MGEAREVAEVKGADDGSDGVTRGDPFAFDAFGVDCPWLSSGMQGKTWRQITGRREKAPTLAELSVRLEVLRAGGRKRWLNVEPNDRWKVGEVSRSTILGRFGGGRVWRASIRWKGDTLRGSMVLLDLSADPTPPRVIPADVLDAKTLAEEQEACALRAERELTDARVAALESSSAPPSTATRDAEVAARARDALRQENLRLWVSLTNALQRENELLRATLARTEARLAAMSSTCAEGERATLEGTC